jgi:hypothetical protein
LLTLVSLVLSLPAAAVEVATLFTAEVAYDQESSDPRADAYEAALQEILLRVSGSGIARRSSGRCVEPGRRSGVPNGR